MIIFGYHKVHGRYEPVLYPHGATTGTDKDVTADLINRIVVPENIYGTAIYTFNELIAKYPPPKSV